MPPVPNPHNGYVPQVDEHVRIVGSCHPHLFDTIGKVIEIYLPEHGKQYAEIRYWHIRGGYYSIALIEIGGLEPVQDNLDDSENL